MENRTNNSNAGQAGSEKVEVVEVVEVVEIEEYAKRGEKPPKAKKYVIRIDKEKYTVSVPHMTGREILGLAGKVPPERYILSQKHHGGHVEVSSRSWRASVLMTGDDLDPGS